MTFNKKRSKTQDLTDRLNSLLHEFDLDILKKVAEDVLKIRPEPVTGNIENVMTFEEAVTKFEMSGKFAGFSKTTRDSYSSELILLKKYVEQHFSEKNATPFLEVVYPTKFLVEYLNLCKSASTRNYKNSY